MTGDYDHEYRADQMIEGKRRCFQCWDWHDEQNGRPIDRHDFLCNECHDANDRRYREAYGDEPLAVYQAEGR